MTATEVFLEWLRTQHRQASFALREGDAEPKLALWSRDEPMALFGAFWPEAVSCEGARAALGGLADKFSDCTEYSKDLVAYGVSGDMAYTVGHERAAIRVDGDPVSIISG